MECQCLCGMTHGGTSLVNQLGADVVNRTRSGRNFVGEIIENRERRCNRLSLLRGVKDDTDGTTIFSYSETDWFQKW